MIFGYACDSKIDVGIQIMTLFSAANWNAPRSWTTLSMRARVRSACSISQVIGNVCIRSPALLKSLLSSSGRPFPPAPPVQRNQHHGLTQPLLPLVFSSPVPCCNLTACAPPTSQGTINVIEACRRCGVAPHLSRAQTRADTGAALRSLRAPGVAARPALPPQVTDDFLYHDLRDLMLILLLLCRIF